MILELLQPFLSASSERFPTVRLRQWGLGQVSNNVGIAISLPIAHANSGYKILVTHYNGVMPDSVVSLSVGQREESHFYVSNKTNDNPAFFWVTIGQ